jgi:hypothetical protein
MATFSEYESFTYFVRAVRSEFRYLQQPSVQSFLAAVLSSAVCRVATLERGTLLWRSRTGGAVLPPNEAGVVRYGPPSQELAPHSESEMKPRLESLIEGRANPRGIACLYMATDEYTALAESRPWVGSYVSIGRFEIRSALRVVDCTLDLPSRTQYYVGESPDDRREVYVWSKINLAFSRPTTRSDESIDYVPTQILAELFRGAGYDGLKYMSSYGDGANIALFDLNAVDLLDCHLVRIDAVNLKYKSTGTSYRVREPNL